MLQVVLLHVSQEAENISSFNLVRTVWSRNCLLVAPRHDEFAISPLILTLEQDESRQAK